MTAMEGFWRSHATDEISGLPWPVEGEPWAGQPEFLVKLKALEGRAAAVSYRGWSNCRLCGVANGSRTFVLGNWQWPEGYRHYLETHNVRPSAEFQAMIATPSSPSGHTP